MEKAGSRFRLPASLRFVALYPGIPSTHPLRSIVVLAGRRSGLAFATRVTTLWLPPPGGWRPPPFPWPGLAQFVPDLKRILD